MAYGLNILMTDRNGSTVLTELTFSILSLFHKTGVGKKHMSGSGLFLVDYYFCPYQTSPEKMKIQDAQGQNRGYALTSVHSQDYGLKL